MDGRRGHGHITRYVAGCRCDECREANRVYRREGRQALKARRREEVPHGLGGYRNWGCRCEVCYEASIQDLRGRQERTVAQARRRRLLWTGPELEIAARTDLTAAQVAELTGRTHAGVINMRTKLRRGDPRVMLLAGIQPVKGFSAGKGRPAQTTPPGESR